MTSKTVVIAVDNSNECLKAVDFALEHFSGYKYNLVHIQPHTVPASFMADVSNRENVAYSEKSHPYDTSTKLDKEQTATAEHFLNQVFLPKASAGGAEVKATLVHTGGDSSRSVGEALCNYVAKVKPAALLMMKESKTTVVEFFLGSVSRYCSVHSSVPVVIVPP